MKRFLLFIFVLFICIGARAETVNLSWYVDNQVYQTTTCETGGNVTPPTAPNKKGYTFQEWLSYTPIEYLESTGTQWIDTGTYAEPNFFRVKGKLRYITARTKNSDAFGTYNGSAVSIALYRTGANTSYLETGSSLDYRGGTVPTIQGVDYEFDIQAEYGVRTGYWNNENVSLNYSGSLCSNLPLHLFGHKSITVNESSEPLRIYKFQIYLSSGIVRDFIPVLDSNDTPCMYDKVTNQFFYNQGTGQFIAGPVVTE